MATWTAPTTRASGALITASIWNTDVTENLKYLKDSPVFDGDISVGDDLLLTSSGAVINFNGGDVTITHSSNQLAFAGAATAYSFSDGRVLVGTTTARTLTTLDSLVQIETAGSTYQQLSLVANRNDTGGASLILGKSRGTAVGGVTVVNDGDNLGFIRFQAADGVDMDSIAAQILAQVDGAPGSNDTPGRLIFSTAADGTATVAERMRITNSGVVIIGLGEASATPIGNTLRAPNGAGTNITGGTLLLAAGAGTGTGGSGIIGFFTATAGSSGTTANTIAERMRITADGNVGIGTITVSGKLNVGSGRSFFGANSELLAVGCGYSQTRVESGQVIYLGASDSTTPDAVVSNANGDARLRITHAGSVAIAATGKFFLDGTAATGDTYLWEAAANQVRLQVGGTEYYWTTGLYAPISDNAQTCGASGYRWSAVWSANGTIQTSDRTVKRDISTDTLGLDFINRLRPVSFTMNDEADDTRRHGLIAQEVMEAAEGESLLGILTGDTDGEYGLNYAGFVPALIKAVQEQQAEIAALKARLN